MNTHDIETVLRSYLTGDGYIAADDIPAICADIEADRERRGEPWGWTVLGVTYPTNWTYVGDLAERRAKSEAKELGDGFVAAPLFLGTAPQPAEPVKVPSDLPVTEQEEEAWQQMEKTNE